MHLRLILFAFALAFSVNVDAETLEPIRLRVPTDEATIRSKCGEAFLRLQKDRLEIEARENFSCLAVIPSNDIKAVEAGFMILCQSSLQSRMEDQRYGEVTVETEVLKTSFFSQYRPLIASLCAARETSRISAYNVAHASAGTTSGGGGAMREGCYFMDKCY